jgi:hypothetical protein
VDVSVSCTSSQLKNVETVLYNDGFSTGYCIFVLTFLILLRWKKVEAVPGT